MTDNGKLPWFPFYPKDFLSDEKQAAMSTLECGAYIRLLCYAWSSRPIGSLEVGSSLVMSRLAGLTEEEWENHESMIMAPFEKVGNRWVQKRLMITGEEQVLLHNERVESGRKGGLSKAKAELQPSSSRA